MEEQRTRICMVCRSDAPSSMGGETLISRRGWRCVRKMEGERLTVVWYCPPCWAKRKSSTSGEGAA